MQTADVVACGAWIFETGTLPRIISFVGGGGKTTTMYQLAKELAEQGKKVLVTTSTHIQTPEEGQTAGFPHLRELADVVWNGNILTAGLGEEAEMERLLRLADYILIEADGAEQMPVKVPRENEPALVPQTGLVIAVAGLSAVGKTFGEACFRFAETGGWLRRAAADRIEPEDIALILMDERGSRKNLKGRQYRIVLNQADGEAELETAKKIHRMLPVTMQPGCAVTGYLG